MPAIGRKKECPEELNSQPGGKALIQGPTRPDWAKCYPASSYPEVSLLSENSELGLQVARCFNRGRWFAYELELSWKKTGRFQPENKGGETMAHR